MPSEKTGVVRWLGSQFQSPRGAGRTSIATDEEQAAAVLPAAV